MTCSYQILHNDNFNSSSYFIPIAPPLPAICSESMRSQNEGSTVVLGYCDLTSPVRPSELQFEWRMRKENGELVDIRSDGRFEVSFDGLLTINDTRPSDSGLYQVNISNSLGSALHSIQLQVYQLTRPGKLQIAYIVKYMNFVFNAIMQDF